MWAYANHCLVSLFPFWFNIQVGKYKIPLVAEVSASPESVCSSFGPCLTSACSHIGGTAWQLGGTAWQLGGMAWQLPRIQTVYRCNVTAIAIPHSTSHTGLGHMILTIFPAARMGLLREATVAVGSTTEVEVVQSKIIMQSTYTSTIKQSLLKWNGHDCNVSMHDAIGFYYCHVMMFWNLIGTANFLAVEVTVWTLVSCQAISPTAWEWG